MQCDLFDFGNHAVEGGVLGGDAAFQIAYRVIAHGGKAFGQHVVTRQVQIDDFITADIAFSHVSPLIFRRRSLQQHAGDLTRFHQ